MRPRHPTWCKRVGLLVAVALLGTAGIPQDTAAQDMSLRHKGMMTNANELFGNEEYAEAARIFERVTEETDHKESAKTARYFAALSRGNAEHFAHAIHHYNKFLQREDLTTAQQRGALKNRAEAETECREVTIKVHLPRRYDHIRANHKKLRSPGPFRWTATRRGRDHAPEGTIEGYGTDTVPLDPGRWFIEVTNNNIDLFEVRSMRRRVKIEYKQDVVFGLEPKNIAGGGSGSPEDEDGGSWTLREWVSYGTMIGGGLAGAAGTALWINAESGLADLNKITVTDTYFTQYNSRHDQRYMGSLVLGTGVGLMGSAAWSLWVPGSVWWHQTVTGAIMVGGGIAGVFLVTNPGINAANEKTPADPNYWFDMADARMLNPLWGMLTGVGSSLIIGSLIQADWWFDDASSSAQATPSGPTIHWMDVQVLPDGFQMGVMGRF